jgi:hypothetical protein
METRYSADCGRRPSRTREGLPTLNSKQSDGDTCRLGKCPKVHGRAGRPCSTCGPITDSARDRRRRARPQHGNITAHMALPRDHERRRKGGSLSKGRATCLTALRLHIDAPGDHRESPTQRHESTGATCDVGANERRCQICVKPSLAQPSRHGPKAYSRPSDERTALSSARRDRDGSSPLSWQSSWRSPAGASPIRTHRASPRLPRLGRGKSRRRPTRSSRQQIHVSEPLRRRLLPPNHRVAQNRRARRRQWPVGRASGVTG